MKQLDKYISRGLLKKVKPNFDQIDTQIKRAHRDIETAKEVMRNDPLWGVTIIYQALLRAARALLFSYGYLPIDGAQHKTTVETTGIILGKEFEVEVLHSNKLRKERNVFFYESEGYENVEDAESALKISKTLFTEIQKHVDSKNPQKKLV